MMLELGVDVKANTFIGDEVCDEFNGFADGSGYVPEKDYPTVSYRFLSTV